MILFYIMPDKFTSTYNAVWLISTFVSTIALILLAMIFWDLASPAEEETRESVSSIQVDDFDEEAELQARIWNSFNRYEKAY